MSTLTGAEGPGPYFRDLPIDGDLIARNARPHTDKGCDPTRGMSEPLYRGLAAHFLVFGREGFNLGVQTTQDIEGELIAVVSRPHPGIDQSTKRAREVTPFHRATGPFPPHLRVLEHTGPLLEGEGDLQELLRVRRLQRLQLTTTLPWRCRRLAHRASFDSHMAPR